MACDLAYTVTAVGGDAVAEALAAIADSDDALRVAVPGNVVDAAGNDVVLALGVDGLNGVPDTNGAGDITGSDVEARGGEAGYSGVGGVACVLFTLGRIVDEAEEDGFSGLRRRLSDNCPFDPSATASIVGNSRVREVWLTA